MANELAIQDVAGLSALTNKQIRFIPVSGFSPADPATDFTIGTPLDVLWTPAGLTDGQGRQSTKFDFGALRADEYDCFAAVDFTAETPTANTVWEYWFLPSTNATGANGNIAGNSGIDADAPGGALGSITLAHIHTQRDTLIQEETHTPES